MPRKPSPTDIWPALGQMPQQGLPILPRPKTAPTLDGLLIKIKAKNAASEAAYKGWETRRANAEAAKEEGMDGEG